MKNENVEKIMKDVVFFVWHDEILDEEYYIETFSPSVLYDVMNKVMFNEDVDRYFMCTKKETLIKKVERWKRLKKIDYKRIIEYYE